MKLVSIVLALGFIFPLSGASNGNDVAVKARGGLEVLTPFPMQVFCRREPQQCRAARDDRAQWDSELAALLETVNDQVNSAIRPRAGHRGQWQVDPASGNCNDYVLSKRSRLIRLGVPAGALRIAVTATPAGAPHAILVVVTSKGDYVLDNLSPKIRSLARSGYSVHMISTGDAGKWVRG